jgi:hypothetical protein
MEYNPAKLFNRLFGDGNTPVEIIESLQERKSLLDLIRDQTKALQAKLGKSDKAVLDDYLDNVRTVERKTQQESQERKLVEKKLSNLMVPGKPRGVLDRFDEQVKLMFDMIAIAYLADITRVVSFIMVAEGSNQTYSHIGVPDSFHPISHHANQKSNIDSLVKIQTWHMSAFAQFLQTLSEAPDGDGSVLDHSIFLYGSNMANSDKHSSWPLPTVIVGGGNGKIKRGGRHMAPREKNPLPNLHLTLLNKMGIEQKKFADSTGKISEL